MKWIEENNRLKATFKFKDFIEAFSFMTEVAFYAEKQGHHPNWTNIYNEVTFELNTHDSGGIVTAKDHKLAQAISTVFEKY